MKDVKASPAGNDVLFEFTIGANYPANADFEICYASGVMPAQMNYRFQLQSFVHIKSPSTP